MSARPGYFSKIVDVWRRRSDYRTLSALSAGSALLAVFAITEPLLDDPMVSSLGDVLLAPILVAITCALTLSSRRSNADLESLAPVARMLHSLRPSLGIVTVLRGVLRELVELTGAREIIVVLENPAVRRLTSARMASSGSAATEPTLKHLARGERATYFFPWPDAPGGASDPRDPGVRMMAFDRAGSAVPDAFTSAHAFERMHAAAFGCGDAWHGRIFILDSKKEPSARVVREFEVMLGQLLPAVAGVADLQAVKRRAAAQERIRLACELHDGVVQELMNADVEIELLRRRPDADWRSVRQELGNLQEQLRAQVTDLRALLNDARSHDGTTSKLPSLIGEVVQRFGRDSGVAAAYRCRIEELQLPRRVSGEMVRIVQEALINVRRHSGARHVVVAFEATPDELILGVQDDGRGFPIAMTAPAIVAERVHAIGGTAHVMAEERGARLEIRLPRNGPWTTTTKRFELSSPTITRFFETG
jgi:signal transduction histidine kinase